MLRLFLLGFMLFSGEIFAAVTSLDSRLNFLPDGQSPLMTVSPTGVGLFTTSPSANLQVNGNAMITKNFCIGSLNSSQSNLHVNGTLAFSSTTIASNVEIPNSSLISLNSANGNITLRLPESTAAANLDGRIFRLKKISSLNEVHLTDGFIDNWNPRTLTALDSMDIIGWGRKWYILNTNTTNINTGVNSDNLILWWSANSSTGVEYIDNTSYLRNGIAKPSYIIPGHFASYLDLPGSDRYVKINSHAGLELTNHFSISLWIARAPSGSDSMVPISKKSAWNSADGYEIEIFDTKIRTWLASGTYVDSSNTLWDNSWTHVVTTVSNGVVRIFRNGLDITSSSNTGTLPTASSQSLNIGNRSGDLGKDFVGSLDDIRTYNTVLSPSDVVSLYSNSFSSTSNLVGHWTFDALASSNTISDSSGYNATGVIIPNSGTPSSISTAGKFGSGMYFDGTDDYIENRQIGISGNASRSFLCWVKVSTWTNDAGIWKTGSKSGSNDFSLKINSPGSLKVNTWAADQSFSLSGDVSAWHHIAVCFDGGAYNIYDNGAFVISKAFTTANTPDYGIILGYWGAYFNGTIDDFRIYNKCLNASEVVSIYKIGL